MLDRRLPAALALLLAGACGGSSSSSSPPPPPPTLTGVSVAPAAVSILLTQVRPLTATATYSDGSSRNVTADPGTVWATATPADVAVSGTGVVSAGSAPTVGHSAAVTATFGGKIGTATVTLALRVAVDPTAGLDPLTAQQWYIRNTGQTGYADNAGTAGEDLKLAATYAAGWSGVGVKVAVVDSGLEIAHEDLQPNVVPGSWNFLTSTADPTSTDPTGDHGTSVAGIIGMAYGNGLGGQGIAPSAVLNGYNFISSSQVNAYFTLSMGQSTATAGTGPVSADVSIFNQSFGSGNTFPVAMDATREDVYQKGVSMLRGGLGAVYVKSAGNGFRVLGTVPQPPAPSPCVSGVRTSANCCGARDQGTTCQNASMDPANTLPYNIVVGALNARGLRSSYSTAGSALWVSAPGGEYGLNASMSSGLVSWAYDPAMVTTDQSGCAQGYSATGAGGSSFDEGLVAANASCNYTSTFNGTSSAAPSTSGAVALLLDAAPGLTWRDVKHVLASTARVVDPTEPAVTLGTLAHGPYVAEDGWVQNAAGYWFSNWYGFGAIDVDAAVAMATSTAAPYVPLPPQKVVGFVSSGTLGGGSGLPIPDADATGVTSAVSVTPPGSGPSVVETVQVRVSATHPYVGDLGIELTSPSGTRSILLNVNNGFDASNGPNLTGAQFASNAFYGEPAAGVWTLKVVDGAAGDVGTLSSWQIRIYGH